METYPKVIVLILSYNGKELLTEAINSYLSNRYSNFSVVVIDNGSTDGTKEFIEEQWNEVMVLRTEVNLKYSGGFNYGLKYAFDQCNADYVLITNNDVKADSLLIESCVATSKRALKIGFVTGKVYYYDRPEIFQSCGKSSDEKLWRGSHIGRNETDIGQFGTDQEIPWCDDIFWLVSKEVYKSTGGGYDTEFAFQAEDFDWQVRAKKAGFSIWFSKDAKLWHKDGMTIGKQSAFKSYYDYRNSLIVHMKYREYEEYKDFFRYLRSSLLRTTFSSLLRFRFKYTYKSWMGFLSAIRWGLKHKKLKVINIFN